MSFMLDAWFDSGPINLLGLNLFLLGDLIFYNVRNHFFLDLFFSKRRLQYFWVVKFDYLNFFLLFVQNVNHRRSSTAHLLGKKIIQNLLFLLISETQSLGTFHVHDVIKIALTSLIDHSVWYQSWVLLRFRIKQAKPIVIGILYVHDYCQ